MFDIMNRIARFAVLSWLFSAVIAPGLETSLPPKPTDLEKQFVAVVERAIATTNVAALTALDYLPGLKADGAEALFGSFYRSMIERDCTKLTLQRADPETATEHEDFFGTKLRESLPVRWILSVSHPPPVPGGKMTTELRAGLFEGKIRFTHPVQDK
jgi:hypothetical protein